MQDVLVTGSSRGIGRAIAKRLALSGWRVLLHARENVELAAEAASECGGVAAPFGADVSTVEGCEQLFQWAAAQGDLAGLVNNAGIYVPLAFDTHSDEAFEENWRGQYEANFGSALRMTRHFVRHVRGRGKILNVCSRVGFRGEPNAAAYAASKAAQINLTRSLAVELAGREIFVHGIAPGWVETAMTREGMDERAAEIISGIPLGRVATPEDCAGVAAFLMSSDGDYLSGQVIDINGASYFH